MRRRRAIRRAVVIAGVTIAVSGVVALALAPPLLPIERAAAWIARPAFQAMTRDPRAHDAMVISIENVPVAGTYCPIPSRYGMTAVPGRDSGSSTMAIPDSSTLLLLGESSRHPAPDAPAKCTPTPASARRTEIALSGRRGVPSSVYLGRRTRTASNQIGGRIGSP